MVLPARRRHATRPPRSRLRNQRTHDSSAAICWSADLAKTMTETKVKVQLSDQSPESQAILDHLREMGCTHEGADPGFLAIDIPPASS
jgi:hypothetical protein